MRLILTAIIFGATIGLISIFENKEPAVNDLIAAGQKAEIAANRMPTYTPSYSPVIFSPTPIPPIPLSTTIPPTPSASYAAPVSPKYTIQPSAQISEPTPTLIPLANSADIQVISFTNEVERGKNAKLKIKILPEFICVLKVTLPSGSISGAQGLNTPRPADLNGEIRWQWRIGSATKGGNAMLDITCGKDSQSLTKSLVMTIIE